MDRKGKFSLCWLLELRPEMRKVELNVEGKSEQERRITERKWEGLSKDERKKVGRIKRGREAKRVGVSAESLDIKERGIA